MFGTKNWYILVDCLLLEWESHPDSTSHKMGPFIRLRPRLGLDWELKKILIEDFLLLSEAILLQTHRKLFFFFQNIKAKKKII